MPKVVLEYKEQAKKRIMDAASAEFAKKGYRKTTMNDIAKRIGVSKGAVYQYFENKEALIGAVVESFIESALGGELSSPSDKGFIEITEGSFGRLLKSMPSWFPYLLCDFMSEAHRDRNAKQLMREVDRKLVEGISGCLEDRKKAGEISPNVDTVGVARGLSALQLGLLAFISTGLPRSKAIEAWTEIVRSMASGLELKK
ncbi:MAG: TetR/AcrR family transcriptional regulator [Thermoplasmata archaeon]|nr:TetR/AcrR family transcriptional regulator [Thermoplasmata archaeon]